MAGEAFDRIDEIIHGRVRLGVMTYLANSEIADFTQLKSALGLTQGNLSVHLRKLEDAGYVAIEKSFIDRKPLTRIRLTRAGSQAFRRYVQAITDLLGQTDTDGHGRA